MEYYLPHLSEVLSTRVEDENASPFPLCTTACDRSQVETIRESLHEEYYARLYHRFSISNPTTSPNLPPTSTTTTSPYGTFLDSSFPPFLGRIVPSDWSPITTTPDDDVPVSWEIRAPYVLPALHWVLRGLVASGHLERLESPPGEGDSGGRPLPAVVITNHAYYCDHHADSAATASDPASVPRVSPYDVLDVKEMVRRKRLGNAEERRAERQQEEEEEEKVEMSAYEKMRAERVARNKERLKLLGLG